MVTGANGYIGNRFCKLCTDYIITGCVRTSKESIEGCNTVVETGDIAEFNGWGGLLQGSECVVHFAARTHIIEDSSKSPLDEFRKVNRDTTLRLAEAAVTSGVKRFVYVSSIGVLGNSSSIVGSFDNKTPYDPQDPYAISKMEAEIGLKNISELTDMEVVIVRPPLVIGPGAPGNFRRLLRLVDTGIPLPLGNLVARKSMISLDNLCDILIKCISAPLPRFSQFVVSDDYDYSTAGLVRLIAKYMGKKQLLLPMPVFFLEAVASLVGKSADIRKLAVPLVVDGSETTRILNWSPVQPPEECVKEAVGYYLAHR